MSEHPTYRGQVLDAAKDPLDLRDLYYEGTLDELPPWVNNRGMVPFVLDQQKEGACTGFALAAVVNFLLHNRAGAPMLKRSRRRQRAHAVRNGQALRRVGGPELRGLEHPRGDEGLVPARRVPRSGVAVSAR